MFSLFIGITTHLGKIILTQFVKFIIANVWNFRGYLLFLLPVSSEESNVTADEIKIWNSSLQEELGNIISGEFYLVGEYQQVCILR